MPAPLFILLLLGMVARWALASTTAPVDDLVYNVLAALVVYVGEADIRVTGATCGRSVLVQ